MQANSVTSSATTTISSDSPVPLYHQVYMVLRDRILSGMLKVGDRVPGELETAEAFGVSRITSKRALNLLADEGLVVREPGRGTRVSHVPNAAVVHGNLDSILDAISAMGLETEVRLLEFGYPGANETVARALRCDPGSVVQRSVRVRFVDDSPFSRLVTFIPADIGRSYTQEDLATTPLLTLLKRCEVEISRVQQTVTAVAADSAVASALKVAMGQPMLQIARVMFDQHDRPVEFITGIYRPDSFQYRMDLTKTGVDQFRTGPLTE